METPESRYWGDNHFLPQILPAECQCSRPGKLDTLLIVAGIRWVTKHMLCDTPVHRQIHTDSHLNLSEAVSQWNPSYNSKNRTRFFYQKQVLKKISVDCQSGVN
tara:strand:+ start:191 stop:502 length:312 start_codon:yes stop_codon:yes gene_type:complete